MLTFKSNLLSIAAPSVDRRRYRPSPQQVIQATALATILALAGATDAHAEVLASSVNTSPQIVPAVSTVLDLNGPGVAGTDLSFNPSANSVVQVTFSAECAVDGTASQNGTINIFVDGIAVAPTEGGDDAFCSGDTTPGFSSLATYSRAVARRAAAGPHVLQVHANAVSVGTRMWLDDIAVVIDR